MDKLDESHSYTMPLFHCNFVYFSITVVTPKNWLKCQLIMLKGPLTQLWKHKQIKISRKIGGVHKVCIIRENNNHFL